jgi:hypothetical protein
MDARVKPGMTTEIKPRLEFSFGKEPWEVKAAANRPDPHHGT